VSKRTGLALAQTYVRFASRQPALLDLMFTSLHRPGADPALRQANDQAFAAVIALIADAHSDGEIAAEDPDRIAMAVLATLQGLAWLANSSVIGDRPIDIVVAETIETLTNGLRPIPPDMQVDLSRVRITQTAACRRREPPDQADVSPVVGLRTPRSRLRRLNRQRLTNAAGIDASASYPIKPPVFDPVV
jgi:Tetracyclin repressor-like, C-terminal domain